MSSEVFTVVKMAVLLLWSVPPCRLVGRYQYSDTTDLRMETLSFEAFVSTRESIHVTTQNKKFMPIFLTLSMSYAVPTWVVCSFHSVQSTYRYEEIRIVC